MTVEMVLEKVKELCEAHGASEVILYGSRAKGTALERSDDGNHFKDLWMFWQRRVKENVQTLLRD